MTKQIPRDQLIVGRYYVGRGRNGNVGLWDGESFLIVGQKGQFRVVKLEGYFASEDGCFQPFREVDEGRVTEALGANGWDAHYARVLEFESVAESSTSGPTAEQYAAADRGIVG